MSANGENEVGELEKAENEKNASFDRTPKKVKGGKKDRNDPTRFQGTGVNFNAKIIGIEPVTDARGDKMCQEAMAKLKMVVKAMGEHKQRIVVNVSLEGLKIMDQRSGSIIHHHAVHRISFISRDITDGRAFGYIYSTGDGNHEFFGIKTEKAAEGLVLTLRDLFQVVFEMKKREVEEAKKQKAEEEAKDKTDSDADKPSEAQENQENSNQEGQEEQKQEEGTLLDLESELNNLQEGINQMSAFEGSDSLSSPGGLSLGRGSPWASSPAPASSASSSPFPVRFESQNDPFTTQTTSLQPPASNLGAPGAAPQTDPFGGSAFGQSQGSSTAADAFPAFPSPPSISKPAAGGGGGGDPFKSDPFLSGASPAAPVAQAQEDKYAAFSLQTTQGGSSGGLFGGTDLFSSPSGNSGGDMFGMSSAPLGGSSVNPAFAVSPIQPTALLGAPEPEAPKKKGDLFSDLDPVGGSKSKVSKEDFFKDGPKPSLKQLGGTASPQPAQGGMFGQPMAPSPFGVKVSDDQFVTARPSSQASDKVDPFDTSAVLQKSVQQGPFDTSQLKPQSFSSPPPPHHKPPSPTGSLSSNDELFTEDTCSSPEKPPPQAPPPPLPKQVTVDFSQAPAPPPRPSMVRHATVDLGDMTPPPIPRRPPVAKSPFPTNPTTPSNPPLPPRPVVPIPETVESYARSESPRRGTFQRQASLPVKPSSSSSPVARARPRPRPRTPAGTQSPTLAVVKDVEPSTPDFFVRDGMARSSDKCDTHIAAKRVSDQAKNLVRNQSEPTMSTKNSISIENDPFSVTLFKGDAGGKRSTCSSTSTAKTPDPFADDLNSDPFAATDPFTSPTDPFSEDIVDKSDLFKTKAVSIDVGGDFSTDPFGSDPFTDDIPTGNNQFQTSPSRTQSQSNQNSLTSAGVGNTPSTSSGLSELIKDQSDPFADDPFSNNLGDSHSDSVSMASSKSPLNGSATMTTTTTDCNISHSFSTNFSDLSLSEVASDSHPSYEQKQDDNKTEPTPSTTTNGLTTTTTVTTSDNTNVPAPDPFGTIDSFRVDHTSSDERDPFTVQIKDPFIVSPELSDPFLIPSAVRSACSDPQHVFSHVNTDHGAALSSSQSGGMPNGSSPFGGMPGAIPQQQPQPSMGNPFATSQWQ